MMRHFEAGNAMRGAPDSQGDAWSAAPGLGGRFRCDLFDQPCAEQLRGDCSHRRGADARRFGDVDPCDVFGAANHIQNLLTPVLALIAG